MTKLLCDLGQCDHAPIHPPRDGHHGEQVFTEKWTELMAHQGGVYEDYYSNVELHAILHVGDELTQRMATVAATFVQWLGTACGRGFINQARRRPALNSADAFVAEWAVENHRKSAVNSGYRAIEHILAPPECRANGSLRYRPELAVEDFETVEHIAYWLGTTQGAAFIAAAEKEIAERLLAEDIGRAVGRRDFRQAKLLLAKVGEVRP